MGEGAFFGEFGMVFVENGKLLCGKIGQNWGRLCAILYEFQAKNGIIIKNYLKLIWLSNSQVF